MKRRKNRVFISHAHPSFLDGMGRIFDFGLTAHEYDIPYLKELREGRVPDFKSSGPKETSAAIRQCWEAVGELLYDAIEEYERAERDKLTRPN